MSLFDFDNKEGLFPGVGAIVRFCLLSCQDRGGNQEIGLSFLRRNTGDLRRPDAILRMSPQDILRMNPNTGTLTAFETVRDAAISKDIYTRIPVLSGR